MAKIAFLSCAVAKIDLKVSLQVVEALPSRACLYAREGDFMEAGKRRLAGDTTRAATTDEVKDLRREARDLKEVVAVLC